MTDSKPEKPIPATPGFHAQPGKEPKFSEPDSIRATPGYHAADEQTRRVNHHKADSRQTDPNKTTSYKGAHVSSEPGKPEVSPAIDSTMARELNDPGLEETTVIANPAPAPTAPAPTVPAPAPNATDTPAQNIPGSEAASADQISGSADQAAGSGEASGSSSFEPGPAAAAEPPVDTPEVFGPGSASYLTNEPIDIPKSEEEDPKPKRKISFFPSVIQEKIDEYTAKGRHTLEKGIDQINDAKSKLSDAKDKAREEAPKAPESSVGTLISRLSDQVHKLVVGEIELAKAKGQAMVKKASVGAALLVVAGVLALYMLGFLLGAAVSAFALVMPLWAAKLAVAGILLAIILILALAGIASLKKGFKDTPAPQEGVKESIDAVKKGLDKE